MGRSTFDARRHSSATCTATAAVATGNTSVAAGKTAFLKDYVPERQHQRSKNLKSTLPAHDMDNTVDHMEQAWAPAGESLAAKHASQACTAVPASVSKNGYLMQSHLTAKGAWAVATRSGISKAAAGSGSATMHAPYAWNMQPVAVALVDPAVPQSRERQGKRVVGAAAASGHACTGGEKVADAASASVQGTLTRSLLQDYMQFAQASVVAAQKLSKAVGRREQYTEEVKRVVALESTCGELQQLIVGSVSDMI